MESYPLYTIQNTTGKNKTSGKQALPDDNVNGKWKPNEEKRDTNTKEVRLKVEMNSSSFFFFFQNTKTVQQLWMSVK